MTDVVRPARGRPITAVFHALFASTARLRMAVIGVIALVALLTSIVPQGRIVSLVLVISIVLVPIGNRFCPPRYVPVLGMLQDHGTALIVSLVVPELWAACAVAVVANSIWSSLSAESELQRQLALMSPVILVAIGAFRQPSGWLSVSLVSICLCLLFTTLSARIKEKFQEREADLALALATSGAIVHVSDVHSGTVESVTGEIEEITGWTADQWTVLGHRELLHPDDVAGFWVEKSDLVANRVIERKGRFRRADGSYVWLRDVSRVVETDGRLKLRGMTMDVTEIEAAHLVIRRQAETDELTGLANRSVLIAELERHLAADRPFALLLLDLDQFKHINDTLGHGFGDDVLVEVGRRLDALPDAISAVVRLGGDEFALIAPDMPSNEKAEALAMTVAEECTRVMSLQGVTISSGVSIGIALAPRDGDSVQTLLRHADIAMYDAKRDRRAFQVFNPDIQQAPLEDLTLGAAIGSALENNEFALHFQPKVHTATGQVVGFEGLARWESPEFGLLDPKRFIHLVTLSNFDTAFTDQVLDCGASFASQCARAGHRVPISVNVSARSLFDDTFPDRVAAVLARHGLSSDQLVIEITEHDIMNRTASRSDVLDRLDEIGVALSVDDFGTGYSSLARLIDLPVSEIKIDRRFIARLLESERDAVIVRSIVELGRNLDLHVVAEGIEQTAEAELLQLYGCNHAQGFLYSEALTTADALRQLESPPFSSTSHDFREHLQAGHARRPTRGPSATSSTFD